MDDEIRKHLAEALERQMKKDMLNVLFGGLPAEYLQTEKQANAKVVATRPLNANRNVSDRIPKLRDTGEV